ncbi:MAG: oligopeptide transporter, OPT family [Proteobacteria bacterium]|nr:oligopeptide transporter, OPT family [Pseudomonadota bacterium]
MPSPSVPPPHAPFVPHSLSPRELSWRALLLGSALGILFAASSVYLAIKVGMTVSASIPIAVLSIAIFRTFGNSTILENTIVQTTGSAGESLAFGVAAALPALLFMGYEIGLLHAVLVAALGGVLGVLMLIPLRHGLIVQEHGKLTYPEGTACAQVLIAGEKGGHGAQTVITGALVGACYKLLYAGVHLWHEVVEVPLYRHVVEPLSLKLTTLKGYVGGSVAMEVSPELLGVGYIIGPKVAGISFAGGVLSYLVLIPAIQFFAQGNTTAAFGQLGIGVDMPISQMSPAQVRNAFVLYIGAGAVAMGGLLSLLRSIPTLLGAFRRGIQNLPFARSQTSHAPLRTERDLSLRVVGAGTLLTFLAILLAPSLQLNTLSALMVLAFSFFFVTVSARITGEIGSSSNPISGMVVATLLAICLVFLLLGWTSTESRFAALTAAAVVGIAASNGGTTAQDLKTAHLIGGTPRHQQLALFVGVLSSALFIGLTLLTLNMGGTLHIPESHPGKHLSTMSEEKVVLYEIPFHLHPQHAPLLASLEKTLWNELGLSLGNHSLRGFKASSFQNLSQLKLTLDNTPYVLSQLGPLGETRQRLLQVGYARKVPGLVDGKYLASEAGDIEYVVDPGIGGRVHEYLGQKLTRYDAPKARLFSLIIDGILTQQLPWALVLIGIFIALMLELCGVPSLPFAVGVYLPISTTAPIFVGGIVRWAADKWRREKNNAEFSPGTFLASGYIAGGAMAGVVVALLNIPQGGAWLKQFNLPAQWGGLLETLSPPSGLTSLPSALWALSAFALLTALLAKTAWRQNSGP